MTQDMTIEQFCTKHQACEEGKKWALASCATIKEVWEKAKPDWLLWGATRPSVLTDKELRLFAVFCARQVQHLMTDPRSIAAIDVAERYAKGEASDNELAAARDAAREAAGVAGVAKTAARGAAWAAWAAAWAAAGATWATWAAAVVEAARATALESQAAWLRENTKPNFL
jgi:hypothetical protein